MPGPSLTSVPCAVHRATVFLSTRAVSSSQVIHPAGPTTDATSRTTHSAWLPDRRRGPPARDLWTAGSKAHARPSRGRERGRECALVRLAAADLRAQPRDRVEAAVHHPFLQRDDPVVGEVDALRADLTAALG